MSAEYLKIARKERNEKSDEQLRKLSGQIKILLKCSLDFACFGISRKKVASQRGKIGFTLKN